MKKTKFKLHQWVVAARDILEPELSGMWGRGKPAIIDGKKAVAAGTHGAIVDLYDKPAGVAVEFFDEDGETIDVVWGPLNLVRPMTAEESAVSTQAETRA
jgi:hypothetical protein